MEHQLNLELCSKEIVAKIVENSLIALGGPPYKGS